MEQINEPKETPRFSTLLDEFMTTVTMPDKPKDTAPGAFVLGWVLLLISIAYATLHGANANTYLMIIVTVIVSIPGGYLIGYSAKRRTVAPWVVITIIGPILFALGVLAAAIFDTGRGWDIAMVPMLAVMAATTTLGAYRDGTVQGLRAKDRRSSQLESHLPQHEKD